ncbi:flagellar biosynthesis protein FliQ [Methylophaga sp. OBS1]|jgi:flagellar biosynthetic protein FliQ|uniref:flagellar biosynthesis protein FliQ n=1 Tax=Methylophaga sp. OBS1 TaxID=2991933 RepID=UPI0019B342EE|nr:flagellar biosynthesis protein FliQ [Methylophaga sp. OBS1]MBD3633319.1 flagellar biosynthesis protein FliQ [Methylophaga sp.]MCX4192946.1 flagellar biosynthesis protein FliQ [Methylophaga sp. OBS1]
MTPETVLTVMQQTLQIISVLIAAILLPALFIGLLVSMFQAATSINEQTLTFIPKLFITLLVLMVAGPWMLSMLISFSRRLFEDIPFLIG